MSRYKVVKPIDHNYLLCKKRHRIKLAIDWIYTILQTAALFICGLNQFNDKIVGYGLIAMGVISIPMTLFYMYVIKKDWKPKLWYDDPDIIKYVSHQEIEKDLSEVRTIRWLETVFLALFSIGLPILGVLRLLGII